MIRQISRCVANSFFPENSLRGDSMTRNFLLAFRMPCLAVALTGLLTSVAGAQYAGQVAWQNSNFAETTLTHRNANPTQSGSTASLSPTSVGFGILALGSTSQPKVVTLTNTGSATIGITSISIIGKNGSEFAVRSTTCGSSLGPGAACTISITFKPSAEGSQSATLQVVDGSGTQTASLTGTGTAVKFTPGGLTFAAQAIGTTSPAQPVTLTNLLSTTLTITSIAIGGADPADFAQTNTCGGSVPAGDSCTISVTFSPTADGSRSANVTVTDNDITSPQKIVLSGTGTGTAVGFTVLPTSIAYPDETVGLQSSCEPVTVTNTGTTPLTIDSFALTPFMVFELQYGYAPRTLSPQQAQIYCIKFVPGAAQAYTGQLSISIAG